MHGESSLIIRPAKPAAVAAGLDDAQGIHLWWLERQRAQGREPLRRILAGYLDRRPGHIRLLEDVHGRPALAGPDAGRLDFNWSHSEGRAVVAVARKLPRLGVDIEHVHPRRSCMAIARRYFATSEHALLERLPEAQRPAAFVRLWTAKEALLKGHGRGLAHGLDKVVLDLQHDRPCIRDLQADLGRVDSWRLAHWRVSPTAFATLCWQAPVDRRIHHFTPVGDA